MNLSNVILLKYAYGLHFTQSDRLYQFDMKYHQTVFQLEVKKSDVSVWYKIHSDFLVW